MCYYFTVAVSSYIDDDEAIDNGEAASSSQQSALFDVTSVTAWPDLFDRLGAR